MVCCMGIFVDFREFLASTISCFMEPPKRNLFGYNGIVNSLKSDFLKSAKACRILLSCCVSLGIFGDFKEFLASTISCLVEPPKHNPDTMAW